MENKFGKISSLLLQAAVKQDKTILEDVYFSAPFKIMRPFYQYKDFMTVMCMSSSAGIMAGDEQEHDIIVKEGAKLEFISQSYEKIHKMDSGYARRHTQITVQSNAHLYYNPLPTLPFALSAFESTLDVHLTDCTSRFVMKEILSAGRCARGELFQYRFYHNLIQVYVADQLIYRDNTRYDPELLQMSSLGMYEDFNHLGTLLIFHEPKDSTWFFKARKIIEDIPHIEGGITSINDQSVAVRVLGHSSEKIEFLFHQIQSIES